MLITLLCLSFNIMIVALFAVLKRPQKQLPFELAQVLYEKAMTHRASRSKESILPQYKFYTALVGQLLKLETNYGLKLKTPLLEVRKAVLKDHQAFKSLKKLMIENLMQMLLMTGMTWGLLYFTGKILGSGVSNSLILVMAFWQLLGLSIFAGLYHYKKTQLFSAYPSYLMVFYRLKCFVLLGRPLESVGDITRLKNETTITPRFESIIPRLEHCLTLFKEQGLSFKDEVSELIDELWLFHNKDLKGLENYTGSLKLVIMPLFFFLPYLAFIMLIPAQYF